jgi:hypothetical protein
MENRKLPSPALLVGMIALVAALAGTAIALPGRNTVNSGDIKPGQVKTSDLRNNAATGEKVKESTLGTVPNAGTVNGTTVESFFAEVDTNQAQEDIELGGVRIRVNCGGGDPAIQLANLSGQDSQLVVDVSGEDGGTDVFLTQRDSSFESGDGNALNVANSDLGNGTARAVFADGTVVTVELSYSNLKLDDTAGCSYWGRVTSG